MENLNLEENIVPGYVFPALETHPLQLSRPLPLSFITTSLGFLIISLILAPFLLEPFATPEEVKPPNGAAKLPLKSQFMHMMVHHNQVPFMSSVIIAIMVGLSVYLGYKLNPLRFKQ